jgi:hypothetical protein
MRTPYLPLLDMSSGHDRTCPGTTTGQTHTSLEVCLSSPRPEAKRKSWRQQARDEKLKAIADVRDALAVMFGQERTT